MKIAIFLALFITASQTVLSFQPDSFLSKTRTLRSQPSKTALQEDLIGQLFDDREDDDKIDNWFASFWDRIWNRDSSKSGDNPIWEGEQDGVFAHFPTKEESGVDEDIFKLCCTIASQLYDKNSADEFKLSTKDLKTDVILYDDHGDFNATNPPFVVAITGKTMVLGWRGTHDFADLLTDAAASPQSSYVWKKHAKFIKAQGAMTAIVNNDLLMNEDQIIEAAKKAGVTEIITTGHSLGGACAQIGHLGIRAMLEDRHSEWHELKGVNVRSVGFSAPMSLVLVKNPTLGTRRFIEDLKDNSCNVIYKNDVIPRGYGYLSFIDDFVDDFAGDGIDKVLGPLLTRLFGLEKKADETIDKIKEQEKFKAMLGVFSRYIHVGNQIFYDDEDGKPVILTDRGAFFKNTLGIPNTLRSVKYKPSGKGHKCTAEAALTWHSHPINEPGLGFSNDELC